MPCRLGHAVLAAFLAAGVAACGGTKKVEAPPSAPQRIRLTSPAFRDGGRLPRKFTCDGSRLSPPLAWSGVPTGSAELVLLVEDLDAPGGAFVHWTVFRIDPGTSHLAAGESPFGASGGKNSFGGEAYGAPCPPKGDKPHRYVFTLYALRARTGLRPGASPGDVRAAVAQGAVGQGRLTAIYAR